ncbi:hypothetical protein SAMN05444000_1176 [Shimia gijangensis]|uniref:Acetolactate synthase n=1 Tax=Shimia gijangensis TaxID=1470563 RepID=A0A1M6NY73_9RHOB|nr:DUF6497 family protein [Shimia gijangensis]SHK00675.1 hypothetical protein SAMN05444000_1176 [Shimia gijangensis]
MGKWLTVFTALGGAYAGPATAGDLKEVLTVPSGYEFHLQEMLFETRQDNSEVARFRYVMPIIGQEGVTFDDVEFDFLFLCEVEALRSLEKQSKTVDQVIISLSDRETEFGATTSVATQFFEAYSVKDGSCIWEGF